MNVLFRWLLLAVLAVGGVYFAGLFGPIPSWPFHGLGVSVVLAGLIAAADPYVVRWVEEQESGGRG